MKIRPDRKSLIILICALFAALIFASCREYRKKPDQVKLIPEKQFSAILTDLYLADGMIFLPEYRRMFSKRDSVSNYIDIIESHGYTFEEMTGTLNYYFVYKPKKLIKIYDQVIAGLSDMEVAIQERITNEMGSPVKRVDGSNFFLLPDPHLKENPGFRYTVNGPGRYTISFTITIYPDDPSYNPHFSAWYCNADSAETGKRIYLPPVKFVMDGQPHSYTIIDKIPETGRFIIKGFYFDSDNNMELPDRHARIENITFSYTGTMPV